MLICRLAYDAAGQDAVRKTHYDAHRAHLRSELAKSIVQSGPLFTPDGQNRKIGALIVFDVADMGEVERFNAADPFISNGVYDRVEFMRWDKTIG
ncbi:MAG: YciI family protein [Alphaproteobacteria bacterium]|nr:YciI family protein [Alphaproteobacteria bacterium]